MTQTLKELVDELKDLDSKGYIDLDIISVAKVYNLNPKKDRLEIIKFLAESVYYKDRRALWE